jgi:hypothetical protein
MVTLSRRIVAILLLVSLALFSALVVVPNVSDFLSGTTTIHVEMSVSYQGRWNGTYYYGSCGLTGPGVHSVSIHGDGGVSRTSVSFRGKWVSGFGFQFRIRKLDNSTDPLRVTVAEGPAYWSYDNSTSAPMGILDAGGCTIS